MEGEYWEGTESDVSGIIDDDLEDDDVSDDVWAGDDDVLLYHQKQSATATDVTNAGGKDSRVAVGLGAGVGGGGGSGGHDLVDLAHDVINSDATERLARDQGQGQGRGHGQAPADGQGADAVSALRHTDVTTQTKTL